MPRIRPRPLDDPPPYSLAVTRTQRLARLALYLGLALHLLFLVSYQTQWLAPLFHESRHSPGQAADFFGIYHAGDRLLHGETIYESPDWPPTPTPDRARSRVPYGYFYRYLPPTAYAFAPVAALLAPWPAYWAWVAFIELLLIAYVLALGRLGLSQALCDTLRGVSLGYFPFWLEQWMGQFTWPLALLIAVTLFAPPRSPRSFWAWVAAISLKQFPALFGWVYLRLGWWKHVAWAALAVIALSAPYFLFFPEDLRHFIRINLGGLPPRLHVGSYGMVSLIRALAAHLPGGMTEWRLGPFTPYPATVLVYLWTLVVAALSLATTWCVARPDQRVPELCSLWVCAFLLVFKDVWEYHAVLLLPVVAALVVSASRLRRPRLLATVLAAGTISALPTLYLLYAEWAERPVESWPIALTLLHYGMKVGPVLALFVVSARVASARLASERLASRPGDPRAS